MKRKVEDDEVDNNIDNISSAGSSSAKPSGNLKYSTEGMSQDI